MQLDAFHPKAFNLLQFLLVVFAFRMDAAKRDHRTLKITGCKPVDGWNLGHLGNSRQCHGDVNSRPFAGCLQSFVCAICIGSYLADPFQKV